MRLCREMGVHLVLEAFIMKRFVSLSVCQFVNLCPDGSGIGDPFSGIFSIGYFYFLVLWWQVV